MLLCDYVVVLLCYYVIVLLCYYVSVLICCCVGMLLCYYVVSIIVDQWQWGQCRQKPLNFVLVCLRTNFLAFSYRVSLAFEQEVCEPFPSMLSGFH